jgi:hypothetical protein
MVRQPVFPDDLIVKWKHALAPTEHYTSFGYKFEENKEKVMLYQPEARFFRSIRMIVNKGEFDSRPIKPDVVKSGITDAVKTKLERALGFYRDALRYPLLKPSAKRLEQMCSAIDRLDHRSRTLEKVMQIWREETRAFAQKLDEACRKFVNSNENRAEYFLKEGFSLYSYDDLTHRSNNANVIRYRAAVYAFGVCMSKEHNRPFVDHLCNPFAHEPVMYLSQFNFIPIIVPFADAYTIAYLHHLGRGHHANINAVDGSRFVSQIVVKLTKICNDAFQSNRRTSILEGATNTFNSFFGRTSGSSTPGSGDRRPRPPSIRDDETPQAFRTREREYRRVLREWKARQRQNNRQVSSDDESNDEPDPIINPHQEPEIDHNENEDMPPPEHEEQPEAPNNDEDNGEYHVPDHQDDMSQEDHQQLQYRSTDLVRNIQLHPDQYLRSSHTTRFGDVGAEPVPTPRLMIQPGDQIITFCDNQNSVRYLVTYGGDDNHIIFNRIIDRQWSRKA